ncbi:MAG: recombination mediator RecR [Candidatus Pacebacteria bacterium]|nr:recombination mediator RecR [Candidatus Paceibacterota bacterium]NUQ57373.1 recombination protein RecR [Candidatus Paceibacter sp.]
MNLEKLIEMFLKFPGVGPRQARRFVYFLAGENKGFVDSLSKLIAEIKSGMRQCESCFHYFEQGNLEVSLPSGSKTSKCKICAGIGRDVSLLMVVEKDVDLENIERTRVFNGRYFVLGGVVELNGGGKTENVRLKELFEKVKKEKPREVILATGATTEGESTNLYIKRLLEPLGVKITKLGRGLSTGAELEYSDSDTIENALENRK